ncbi:MAG TPA: pilus assembly protein TadG-related protein [Anaerolineaceae bacterium]|nr:pilus assembly protein TadG-related protein [Anaerolineaceae bacterium]
MKPLFCRKEDGQVLILVALVLVGVLLFTSLAIDGGMIYSDRRIAQNAADSAALAGAGEASQIIKTKTAWNCADFSTGTSAWTNIANTAVASALSNDFSIETDLGNKNGVEITCSSDPNFLDVKVIISKKVETSLIHMVYPSDVVNTVVAVSRVRPPAYFAAGMAIVALGEECTSNGKKSDGGITFTGDADTIVTMGGAYSNACVDIKGTAGSVQISNGIGYLTNWKEAGKKTIVPPNAKYKGTAPIQIDDSSLIVNCPAGKAVDVSVNNGTQTISPGNFKDITVHNKGTLKMEPGLYCISGTVSLSGTVTGTGVTLYMPDTAGSFSTAGDAQVKVTAPPQSCHSAGGPTFPGCPPSIGGMLIYYLPGPDTGCPSCSLALRGNASSVYTGTVYAPNSTVEVGGNDSAISEVGAQVLARTVFIHGTSALTIKYDKDLVYKDDMKLWLNQ